MLTPTLNRSAFCLTSQHLNPSVDQKKSQRFRLEGDCLTVGVEAAGNLRQITQGLEFRIPM